MPSSSFELSFSETVKNYNLNDSTISLLDDNIIKSIIFLIDQNGDSIDYQASYNGDTTLITIEPEVLLTELEHHSNYVPWHYLRQTKGIKIELEKKSAHAHSFFIYKKKLWK